MTSDDWHIMSKKLEKYLQCCWYSEASIHCITAPDPLLPKTFRQRQSNVSLELMRKLERSLLQDPVSSFFLRIESLILLMLLCIRIVPPCVLSAHCRRFQYVWYGRSSGSGTVAIKALLHPPGSQYGSCCHATVLAAAWRQAGAQGRERKLAC